MANTSAVWQQDAHTTDQLSSPSCSTRVIQKNSLTKTVGMFLENGKTERARGLGRKMREDTKREWNDSPEIPDRKWHQTSPVSLQDSRTRSAKPSWPTLKTGKCMQVATLCSSSGITFRQEIVSNKRHAQKKSTAHVHFPKDEGQRESTAHHSHENKASAAYIGVKLVMLSWQHHLLQVLGDAGDVGQTDAVVADTQ